MRTVLYANKDLSTYLNDHFVLLWSSERPVPKVTIDFGDGRVLERTITGNAVHYVLDAAGNPLDALPGLYGPKAFLAAMERSVRLHDALEGKTDTERQAMVATYHRARMAVLGDAFAKDLAAIGADVGAPGLLETESFSAEDAKFLREVDSEVAVRAISRAMGKMRVERDLGIMITRHDRSKLEAAADDTTWRLIAAKHEGTGIDSRTLAVMARELPEFNGKVVDALTIESVRSASQPFEAEKAIDRAIGKESEGEGRLVMLLDDDARTLTRLVTNFEEALAQDTLRNEYVYHAQIHQWFSSGDVKALDSLNERVYREVFLTPRSDPWLGLGDTGAYTGIDGGGRHE